ncbi:MAG: urease accessory protein, partial [Gammaproteobacteria bacterium]|nr:urease accessory protein [Gammaproteobacteria bacterium]
MTGFLFLGFMLGIRHALEADHIATVATLACSQASRGQILRQGLTWGIGHSFTLMLFGVIVLSVNSLVPERLVMGLEIAVGCLMILLGLDVIRKAVKSRIH